MDRAAWLVEKQEEIEALAGMSLNEVMPSRRDFTLFVATQKRGIALVPRLKRRDPDTGGAWPQLDLLAAATSMDDAETAAIAVCTSRRHGGSIGDLRSMSRAVTAPVLRDDLILDERQLYDSRLNGADAVLLPAADLGRQQLRDLAAIAASLHMTVVVEVMDAAHLDPALAIPTAFVGLRRGRPDKFADLEWLSAMARAVPTRRTVVLLDEVRALDDLERVAGLIDAAVVGDALLNSADAAAEIARFASKWG
jgi:indole-3-glycerol phosphate synthase